MRRALATFVTVFALLAGAGVPAPAGGFDRAISSVTPRVVKLYGLRGGKEPGYGTGVIVSEDGLILTVFSLLIDARRIRAVTSDGTLYDAGVVHRDRKRQLALLQLSPIFSEQEGAFDPHGSTQHEVGGSLGLPFFDLSVEAELRPGDWILAAGNPFKVAQGAEPVSVVHGVFSARTRLDARRRLKDFPYRGDVLVIDAITSNPGAPGGALVTVDGRFVGMIGREVISNLTHTHFNYAVPRDVLHAYFVEAIATLNDEFVLASSESAAGGRVTQREGTERNSHTTEPAPFDAGIRMSRVGYRRVLPFVERVRSGSPAQKAGVRKDDLILSVNGRSVPDVPAFDTSLGRLMPNEPIDLVIRRGRTILSIRIEKVEGSQIREGNTPKEQ